MYKRKKNFALVLALALTAIPLAAFSRDLIKPGPIEPAPTLIPGVEPEPIIISPVEPTPTPTPISRRGGGKKFPEPVPVVPLVPAGCVIQVGYTAIKTEADLALLRTNSADSKFWLCKDITLTQIWEPISSFGGTFYGNNKTIRNLSINRTSEANVGFIRTLEVGASVSFLHFEDPNVNGAQAVGTLAAINRGLIDSVTVSGIGNITGSQSIGGLVGVNYGSIKKSSVGGDIEVLGGASEVGGLVGLLGSNGVIEDSFAFTTAGPRNATTYVGGLVGRSTVNSQIIRSGSQGKISGNNFIGGLVGQSQGKITQSFSTAEVSGSSQLGGLVGRHWVQGDPESALIENSFSLGTISGSTKLGGLVGESAFGKMRNCFFRGKMNGGSTGHALGWTTAGSIENIYSTLTSGLIQGQTPGFVTTIVSSYYLNETAGGNARTEQQLKTLGTFQPAWNISYVKDATDTLWKMASPDGTDFPNFAWLNPIVQSDPPTGAIDARQPFASNGTTPVGWMEVTLTFAKNTGDLYPRDFLIYELGGDQVPPKIYQVSALSETSVRLSLNRPIDFLAWTGIIHKASGTEVRLGFLPGDVNGDGTAAPTDILELIDVLNLLKSRPIWSTDIDRSNVAAPTDILALIDLLNNPMFSGAHLP